GSCPGEMHGGVVDDLGLCTIAGAVQFVACGEKRERLQHLRAGLEKFPMQFAEGVRVLDGHFGRELAAAFAGADFVATRTAVHVTATLEFDEVTAVSEDSAFFQQSSDGFHATASVFGADVCV